MAPGLWLGAFFLSIEIERRSSPVCTSVPQQINSIRAAHRFYKIQSRCAYMLDRFGWNVCRPGTYASKVCTCSGNRF
jgi:hypothetical protein